MANGPTLPLAAIDAVTPAGVAPAVAAGVPLTPSIILGLCVLAGVATWLMLPARREKTIGRIGAVLLLAAGVIFAALLFRTAAGDSTNKMGPFFWVFALTALAASVRVITHNRPIYSALYFVLTVFATAGLFVLLWAEFIAAALVLIYAGAILITYVFVIMLASEASTGAVGSANEFVSEHDAESRSPFFGAVAGFAILALLLTVIFDRASATDTRKAQAVVETKSRSIIDETVAGLPDPQNTANPQAGGAGEKVADRTALAQSELTKSDAFSGSAQALGLNLIQTNPINLQLAAIILTLAMVGAITLSRRKVITDRITSLKSVETVVSNATPISDDPHSIPVYGTTNPRQKAYPEN